MAIEDGSLHWTYAGDGTDAIQIPFQTETVETADFDYTPAKGAVWLEIVSGVPTLRGVLDDAGTIVDLGGRLIGASTLNVELADGQDGGSDPTYDITGAAVGDEVVFVGHLSTKAAITTLADVTSDFSFTDDDELTDGGPTDYSSDQLLLIWVDRT